MPRVAGLAATISPHASPPPWRDAAFVAWRSEEAQSLSFFAPPYSTAQGGKVEAFGSDVIPALSTACWRSLILSGPSRRCPKPREPRPPLRPRPASFPRSQLASVPPSSPRSATLSPTHPSKVSGIKSQTEMSPPHSRPSSEMPRAIDVDAPATVEGPNITTTDTAIVITPDKRCTLCVGRGVRCTVTMARGVKRRTCDTCIDSHKVCSGVARVDAIIGPLRHRVDRTLIRFRKESLARRSSIQDADDTESLVEKLAGGGSSSVNEVDRAGKAPSERHAAKRARATISSAHKGMHNAEQIDGNSRARGQSHASSSHPSRGSDCAASSRPPSIQERVRAEAPSAEVEVVEPRPARKTATQPPQASAGAAPSRFESLLVDAATSLSDLARLVDSKDDYDYEGKCTLYRHGLEAIEARVLLEAAHLDVELDGSSV
ncbi:uncharacterized protein PFL1_00263 [Pseudozyma flocculosa PF-1]|uniref:uncharacterized protein n=1 Tax=Pseudozyma flocculosa PF-1 TaxID=1277687 RepID=UPI0004561A21|nr:uncharacterized protein PFL1_00263 [Pseudozyma flocculosa PF-1]EPQ32065.1 hypothetical protein PFL1_00263 [Pseudozyma flocculosa PF-1]